MARKIFCDGCDTELPTRGEGKPLDRNVHGVTVSLERNGHAVFSFDDLDLCESCARRLTRECDVRKWPRPAKHLAHLV